MSADLSNSRTRLFYPHHKFTKREVDTVLLAAQIMSYDYCRHYPEAEKLAVFYKDSNIKTAGISSKLIQLPKEELDRRSDAAIALGFYVLSAPVALYFMRLSPTIYINSISSYMDGAEIDWDRISLQDTFISYLLYYIVKEMVTDNHEAFMKKVINDLPVPEDYREEISDYMLPYLNQNKPPAYTVH